MSHLPCHSLNTLLAVLTLQIQFHGSNLKTLHDKISPRILPEEFGGEAGPMDNVSLVAAMLKKEHDFRGDFIHLAVSRLMFY